jgi:radical SAM superfamily enzyme YgiQ (UPF0313 family)
MTPPRILLIQPPLEDFYTTPIRLYPLGLLYCAGVLETMGCTAGVLDCLTPLRKRTIPVPQCFNYLHPFIRDHQFPFKAYFRFGMPEESILSAIRSFEPDMVGISAQFTAYFETAARLTALIKKSFQVPVFIGGNHATVFSEAIKEKTTAVDFVLPGHAESCLPLFFRSRYPRLPGDCDALDWADIEPPHHLLTGEHYTIGRKPYLSLVASRGCPHGCDFCNVHLMAGREIRYRAIDAVISEMRWNYANRMVRIFNFEDDNLSCRRNWFSEFLRAVTSDSVLRGIELTAMNGMCYPTLDEEILTGMKHAGFTRLNLSYVTQDTALRERYHRPGHGTTIGEIVATARSLGFFITVYLIIGLPGQTYKEAKETIDYLLGLKVLVGPSVFYLTPGSPLSAQLNLPPEIQDSWNLYRSSAFAVETDQLSRRQLIELFTYTREKNLINRRA